MGQVTDMEQMHYEGILEVQVFLGKPVEHYFSLHVLIVLAMESQ